MAEMLTGYSDGTVHGILKRLCGPTLNSRPYPPRMGTRYVFSDEDLLGVIYFAVCIALLT